MCGQPKCDKEWSYAEVRKMALLTPEEMEHFEKTMALNASKHFFDSKLVSIMLYQSWNFSWLIILMQLFSLFFYFYLMSFEFYGTFGHFIFPVCDKMPPSIFWEHLVDLA